MRELKLKYEMQVLSQGKKLIAGMDEVGRGPLAGPVVAACVILPLEEELLIEGVDDSKKLSRQVRARLNRQILERALAVGIGVVDASVIDEINILQATKLAMRNAFYDMNMMPDVLFIDAVEGLGLECESASIIGGDASSYMIAAASIVAKECRDSMMEELDRFYPAYGFKDNMGYGTKVHTDAIRSRGICAVHRRSFTGGILNGKP